MHQNICSTCTFEHVDLIYNYYVLHIWHVTPSLIDTKKQQRGKRYLEQTSETAIGEDMKKQCCSSQCLEKFTFSFVANARRSFWEMVTMKQNEKIDEHRDQVSEEKCVIDGHLVCTQSWRIIHGVSRSRSVNNYCP